jgi:cytochrome c peroxidase
MRSWVICSGCRCSPRSLSDSCSGFSARPSTTDPKSRPGYGTDRSIIARLLVVAALSASCGPLADAFCETDGCGFTEAEWQRISSLANLGPPPPDRSNRYVGNRAAARLGQRLYFDARFSGTANLLDSIGRPRPYARAAKGEPIEVSCATCHDPARGGTDHTSTPNNVSIGAGWYDVNSQPTRNAAYYDLIYWNVRTDSLWAQIIGVSESAVSMNGNRVHIARVLHDAYGSEYAAIFPEYPLPFHDGDNLPLDGKPGRNPGCQVGDPKEPFGDAFDCMSEADQAAVTRAYVNFAKVIAAYEYELLSVDSAFDLFVREGPRSTKIPPAAIRGAKLFVGKASCIDCHSGKLLSDNRWHNVGTPQIGDAIPSVADCPAGGTCDCVQGTNCLPWGVYTGLGLLKKSKFRRDSMYSDDPKDDSRAKYYELELSDAMKGAWRTPSLRDVAMTAPYMHDGAYATLEEVVHHYNMAEIGEGSIEASVAVQLHPLGLTVAEEADLVEFLNTLTGAPLPVELVTQPPPS